MIRKFLMAAILMVSVTAGAMAQEKDTVRMSEQAKALQLASDLVKYGYANNSASSLIEAAKIIKETGFKANNDLKAEHSSTDNSVQPKTTQFTLDADKLLTDATKLAAGDKNLLALAETVKKTATRGSRLDYVYERVYSRSTDSYSIDFNSPGWYYVYLTGDGTTDLDLYLYDCNGNSRGSDTRSTDYGYISFYVSNTYCKYQVKIKNLGGVYNDYYFSYGRQ
ncbi:MAG: hypothetical protein K5685_11785 [Bacteroidales bacterium]|nr:hypothetical protein [Bacteroidales bacterium]